jgi:hypothetical protein
MAARLGSTAGRFRCAAPRLGRTALFRRAAGLLGCTASRSGLRARRLGLAATVLLAEQSAEQAGIGLGCRQQQHGRRKRQHHESLHGALHFEFKQGPTIHSSRPGRTSTPTRSIVRSNGQGIKDS